MISSGQIGVQGNGSNNTLLPGVFGKVTLKVTEGGTVYVGAQGVGGDPGQAGAGFPLALGETVQFEFHGQDSVYFQSEPESTGSVIAWMVTT
jgi:hypothetical protein